VTFVVLYRTEDPLTEQTIALRLIRTIVDGFRLEDFTVRSLEDHLGRSKTDGDLVKTATWFCVFS
jgi:hypothetical protein